jgi:CRP-like cAMP-binding protein
MLFAHKLQKVTNEGRPANRLLRVLNPAAYDRLAPRLHPVELRAKQVLYRPNQAINEVYFPETAVICQMTVMSNGDTLETATVGLEGASWISAHIGAPSMPCETIVAIGGKAQTLAIEDLSRELEENDHFADVLTQYSHALLIHSMRLTGCTGLHTLEQRCARWILTTLDRVPANRFSITHEFLSMLLGCSRPSATLAITELHRKGMLKVERGRVMVVNRDALLSATCECYAIIKANYEQVGR